MPTVMPLKGTVDEYYYEFIQLNPGRTQYMLTSPAGTQVMVTCYSPDEIRQLTSDPASFWKSHVNTQ